MTAATYEDVVEILGDVDELYIERIVDTGATVDEITEAVADLEGERRFKEQPRLDATPRSAAVRMILEELFDDENQVAATPSVGDSA